LRIVGTFQIETGRTGRVPPDHPATRDKLGTQNQDNYHLKSSLDQVQAVAPPNVGESERTTTTTTTGPAGTVAGPVVALPEHLFRN